MCRMHLTRNFRGLFCPSLTVASDQGRRISDPEADSTFVPPAQLPSEERHDEWVVQHSSHDISRQVSDIHAPPATNALQPRA